MKRIISFILLMILLLSLAIPAYAVTPPLKTPSISIPDISDDIKVELPNNFWDNWFKNHPLPKFNFPIKIF